MRIFRKRKPYAHYDGASGNEPLPDIVYQMGAEAAARFVAQNPYPGNNAYRARDVYAAVPMADENPYEEMYDEPPAPVRRSSSSLNMFRSAFGLNRSGSRERFANDSFDRYVGAGSPQHFVRRSRPASPELMHPRAASPHLFAERERGSPQIHYVQSRAPSPLRFNSRPRASSPEIFRRLERAQLSQDLQNAGREQRRRENMIGAYPAQYMAPFQQPFYPMMNFNANQGGGWNMMQQPQIYSYF